MTDRVIDASALAYAFLGKTSTAAELRARLRECRCHAPHLIDAELGNVLRKRARAGHITATEALTALRAARVIIAYRYPNTGTLAEHAWGLRNNLSFYDALYASLAMRLELSLLTGDKRLSNAPGLTCDVELLE